MANLHYLTFGNLMPPPKKGYGSFIVVALSLQKSIDANSQLKRTKLPLFGIICNQILGLIFLMKGS
jgi:hypothetical protein